MKVALVLQPRLARFGDALRALWQRPGVAKGIELVSVVLLLGVLGAYLATWLQGQWGMLTDPNLQNSDARTSIFPFHRYGPERALADDPIAQEMLGFVPLGVHALYRVLVPASDVFVAPKIVQAIALGVLLWAGVVMARSRRTGLGAGVLLLFLVLHDWFAVYRIAGGLPRAFGFPFFALWLAGVLSARPRVRRAAPVLAALTYPSVMNMLLAAEGLYALRGAGRLPWRLVGRRLLRYGAVVAVCFVAALPAVLGGEERGPIHTLEQAEAEPAFSRKGRLGVLPFDRPLRVLAPDFIDQLTPRGRSLVPALGDAIKKDGEAYAVLAFSVLLLLPLLRLSPAPKLAIAFFCGMVVLFVLSRTLAFRLYSPERYHSFGMRMASTVLIASLVGQVGYWLRPPLRNIVRNLTVAGFILGVWTFFGDGIVKNVGMTIDQRRDRPLYEFIATLPLDVRFATHPDDGDGIPYYSARAIMGAYETLQPWFVDSWRRQKERCEETLSALYATDREKVLAYAQKHKVTHFLLHEKRYGSEFRKRSGSFEPFTTFARDILKGVEREDLVLGNVPPEAVVFRRGPWQVVDVSRLEAAWRNSPR